MSEPGCADVCGLCWCKEKRVEMGEGEGPLGMSERGDLLKGSLPKSFSVLKLPCAKVLCAKASVCKSFCA